MIEREFRLVCRGIQLISVFEFEEFSRNPTLLLLQKGEIKTSQAAEIKEAPRFEEKLIEKKH
jgi:hypothetical protein